MSAYKILGFAGIGALIGGIFAAPVLAASYSVVPKVTVTGTPKVFLSNCVANGTPNFQIVVGTNGALASDTVAAAWILGALEQHLYTVNTTKHVINIPASEIKNNVNVTVTNKKVKLEVGKYTTEYNESFTLTPSATKTMNFTILNNTTIDGIKYNETATLENVKMVITGPNSTIVQVPAEGLYYTYRLYNATNNTTNLYLVNLTNKTLTLFGKSLTVYNVVENSATNYTIELRQEVNKTTIEKGEVVSLKEYGAPYEIKLYDIAEQWTTNGTKVIIVDVINANTGQVVDEITNTPAEVSATINEKYLKDYNIRIDITNVVKSGTTETAYADLIIIKNEFNLTADNATHDVSDELAKFLGLEAGKWEYKIMVEPNPEIVFIYKDQLNITPSEKPVTLPGGLSLYVTQPKATNYYTAQVTVGSYVKSVSEYNTSVEVNTTDNDTFNATMEAAAKAIEELINDTLGENAATVKLDIVKNSTGFLYNITIYDKDNNEVAKGNIGYYYNNSTTTIAYYVKGTVEGVSKDLGVKLEVYENAGYVYANLTAVDFKNVEANALSGFDAINDTDTWNVTYTPAITSAGDFLLNVSITNSTDNVEAVVSYNVSSGKVAVYNGTEEILGYTNLLPKVVLAPYPETEPGTISYNKLVLIAPDKIPEVKIAREAKRVLESAKTYVLGEGQNISVGDTTVEVQAITEDVNIAAKGINITYNTTNVKAPELTAAQLENLVTTDEQWLSEAQEGMAKDYVITVGSRLVNNLTEAVVCSGNAPGVEIPCRNGEANNPCGCDLNFTASKANATLAVTTYTVNGHTYHVMIVAGSRAQDTLAVAKEVVSLIESLQK